MTGFLRRLRLAISFLTIVPVAIDGADDSDVAASMALFPLVGALIGAALVIEDRVLAMVFGHWLRSAIIVLSISVLTGAVHLDGLADTADALGAGRDRERALTILRDSRIGVFGAIALFFTLALEVLALADLYGRPRLAALILAPMLARWALVAVSYRLDYLRAKGAGSAMIGRDDTRNLVVASLLALPAMLLFRSRRVLIVYAIAALTTTTIRAFYRRWMGGVSGDLIGACGEIVEVLVMLMMAAR